MLFTIGLPLFATAVVVAVLIRRRQIAKVIGRDPVVASCCWSQVQRWVARLEEAFLLAKHGEEYRRYAEKTGRFWPRAR